MKKESDKKNKPWKGSRREEMSLNLPSHFIMLCHLLEVPAEKVLHDFMNTIAMESYGLKKEHQQKLISYFIDCGYGQQHYSQEDILKMFHELSCIGTLWPKDAPMKVIDQHVAWREMYHKQWFKKWFRKIRRKEVYN